MNQKPEPELKYFKVISLGETTYTWAPSRQSLMEDFQRMGVLDKETVVEEADPAAKPEKTQVAQLVHHENPKTAVEKIFTIPGGKKLKIDAEGRHYSLEWYDISIEDLIKRAGCQDLEVPKSDDPIRMMDWVELEVETEEEDEVPEEKEEDASETNLNV